MNLKSGNYVAFWSVRTALVLRSTVKSHEVGKRPASARDRMCLGVQWRRQSRAIAEELGLIKSSALIGGSASKSTLFMGQRPLFMSIRTSPRIPTDAVVGLSEVETVLVQQLCTGD